MSRTNSSRPPARRCSRNLSRIFWRDGRFVAEKIGFGLGTRDNQNARTSYAHGHPLRQRGGHPVVRRPDRHPHGRRLRRQRRDGPGAGPLPRLSEERRVHAAGHPQPPPRRLQRPGLGVRAALHPAPGPARRRRAQAHHRSRPGKLGHGPHLRRAVGLPQRPGERAGAHGHHRPPHGLRHHRRRARLRPGEVQEARRRRLLQAGEPRHSRGPGPPGLLPHARSRRSSATWWAGSRSPTRPRASPAPC